MSSNTLITPGRCGAGARLSDIQYNAFYFYTMIDPRTQTEACKLAGISRQTGRVLEAEFYGPQKKKQRPVRPRKPPVPKMPKPARVTLNPALHSPQVTALGTYLRKTIIGQEDVITAMLATYEMFLAGLSPVEQPVGNFFLLGPTGCGKTLSCEALASGLQHIKSPGSDGSILKVDCAEYQHSHEIAKLLGSPPGYLGHRETQALLTKTSLNLALGGLSIVLFDEIEKASSSVAKLLLGILDKATVTLGDNSKTSFKNCLIFMTSNIAADKMQALFTGGVGFTHQGRPDQISKMGLSGLKKQFSPEFFNRLDRANIVTFKPLSVESIAVILELELEKVIARVAPSGILLKFTPEAKALLTKEGFDPQYGARPLLQAVKYHVLTPLSAIVASGQVKDTGMVVVGVKGDGLVFEKVVKEREGLVA